MLVISRKAGESIVISENIKITVVSMGSDKVALGIDAPKDIRVIREELMEIIEANQASAEKPESDDYQKIAHLIKIHKNMDDNN